MLLQLDPGLRERIFGVRFGCATISGIAVRDRDEQIWQQMQSLGQQMAADYTLEQLSEQPQIATVRGMQRAFGFDPTRYRPSSEALLRRVLKGQGLPQVNTAVDINNLCSLEFLLPMCMYDLQHVKGSVEVRIAAAGTAYPGIGRQTFQVENKVIIADDDGVMGTTVSDSERTKVTTETKQILAVIYAPAESDLTTIERHMALTAQRMIDFHGGRVNDMAVLTV
ncbi:tRNA-binding protein [Dictyobacter alpinus]|uniref:tRNA-binding protein n=1 Tax=Dictyobacter alpinus TaxID=2014873 RepID=A0A402B2E7_9CHLR|nr:phenylalanine--tRNA ligase beta subunit-related protein [Dictyobacter alpinus]GCE25525.1 tRNA-binding protein [Dictyobacter alpinus]